VLRDGARLPDAWLAPLAGSVQALLDRTHGDLEAVPAPEPADELQRVAPGSLGTWADEG
jgi:hypothetical protein